MQFIETSAFTKQVTAFLSDEEYMQLQAALIIQPDLGDLIPGSGGLRKLRWGIAGKGKRGGARTIYYWDSPSEVIYMMFMYKKSELADLTQQQLKALRRIVEEYLR